MSIRTKWPYPEINHIKIKPSLSTSASKCVTNFWPAENYLISMFEFTNIFLHKYIMVRHVYIKIFRLLNEEFLQINEINNAHILAELCSLITLFIL